ncbi:MAG: hypothetical protein ACJ74Z_16610 [Bryobacteraceae bacterium]
MRLWLGAFTISLAAFAVCKAAPNRAAATVRLTQDISPRIGVIEVYGARKVPLKKIRSALGVSEGDILPVSREAAEDRISGIPGVVASRIEAACCEGRKMVLYVGVEERDAPHFEFRPAPSGDSALPEDVANNYHALMEAVAASIRGRNADEDLTNGYSLMADPQCRELQEAFIPMLARELAPIDQVLRESQSAEQRAIAAYVLQYALRDARSAKTMLDGLQYALQDREDTVRENAMRSLKAVEVGAKLHPEQGIRIEPTWLVELMNSIVWSDRRNASLALVNLTDQRDRDTLELLRQRALASVVDMARWHDLEHALPGFILAGRLAGLDEKEIQAAWISGNREAILERALKPSSKPGGAGVVSSLVRHQAKQQEAPKQGR